MIAHRIDLNYPELGPLMRKRVFSVIRTFEKMDVMRILGTALQELLKKKTVSGFEYLPEFYLAAF